MLRNRGVNVTERRIRHDVLKAYEYDIFDARPRWRGIHETGCQANFYRQPRYCTARSTRPVYHTARSSITSYGVKRVYLPDEDWGAGSAESTVYVRNPRYNMGSYYPNEPYRISGERPYRRDLGYEGYYSRRPSSMYIDDDDYCPKWHSRHDRKLVRKVTRKLSPIFTCDCATTSNVRQLKKNNNDIDKDHHNDLSKEAKELSLDIFKIISLLQKFDGEDEEQFSSSSLLQNIHNLDCRSSNSVAKLITQRVNICQKMERHKQIDPLTKFKTASGVRSKLEALVEALKRYEAEKSPNRTDSSNYGNVPKYNNYIPSDPPSLELPFFNGKDLKSSTNIHGGKQKNIVSQTEKPKMSNKSVYGKVKLKKGDSSAERKSLRSRLSWRKKESSGIKVRRDSGNEGLTDKKAERKRSFFCKTKSKSRIRSIIEPEQLQSEKNDVSKQGQATNKPGLNIKIGGIPQRKKSAIPEKEKHKEKMPKTWIKKFLDDKKDTKNNIRVRWNNKSFYTKSSSTIFELVNNVYKQMGIKNSKSDETSTSKHKKTPKKPTHKHSKTRMPKSSKKPKYKQKLETYMMPQIIVPGPVYTPNVTNNDTKNFTTKPRKPKPYMNEFTPNMYNGLNTTGESSRNYFEIQFPNNFFDPGSTSEAPTSEQEYKIVEYEATKYEASEDTLIDYLDGMGVDQEYALESISLNASEDVHPDVVQASNSLCFPKRCEDGEMNIIPKEPESEPNKSRIQITEETEPQYCPKSCCSLAKKICQDEFNNWQFSSDSFLWSANYEDLDKVSTIPDDYSIKTDIDNATVSINDNTQNNLTNKVAPKDSKEVNGKRKFSAFNNNFVQWKNRTAGTFSESIVGINSRKPVVFSVFWNLFKLLRKEHSPMSKIRLPPQDMSVVQPPGIVSQPECSYETQNVYLTRRPLLSQKLASAALRAKKEVALVNPSLICKSLCSLQIDDLAENAFEVDKPENISMSMTLAEPTETDKALMLDEPSEPINVDSVQSVVADETQVEQEASSTPLTPLCQIRLVRSVHTDLPTERNIKPKAVRSVILLQHQIHQFNSQLLLFVRPFFNGRAVIERTLDKYKQSVAPQPPTQAQGLFLSSKCGLQNLQLESADNKVLKETANDSKDIVRSKYSADIVLKNVSSNRTGPSDVCSKQEDADTKTFQNFDKYDKLECRETFRDNKPTKSKQLGHVTQMSTLENNTIPPDIPCILDKNPAVQFSVEVTKGDQVTKIFIRNRQSNKIKKPKLTNLRISQDPVVTDNAEPIKESTKIISQKKIKLCINITNTNAKEAENRIDILKTSQPDHVFEDQLPRKKVVEVVKTDITDLESSIYKSPSLQPFTECSQIDDMSGTNVKPIDVTRSTSERRIHFTELNDSSAADDNSSIDSYWDISAEAYIHEILGNADVDHMKLKKLVEMKRTLNAMTMLNVGAFAKMALMRELASDHNNTYTSLRQQLKRRKKIVSILSEINIRNIGTDYVRQSTGNADIFDDSGSSGSCSLCNILARKLNSHRCVEVDMPNFNVRAKGDIAANYVPELVSPVIPRSVELEGHLSYSSNEEQLFNNSHTRTFINIDDTGIGAVLKSIMEQHSSKRNKEKIHEAKPICWCCVKNMNKKTKKNQTKKWQRTLTRHVHSWQNDAIANADSCKSQNSFTEYKVRFKNDEPMVDKPEEKLYFEVNKSDILQSCKIKKAVLQIYSDETVENEGYLVAKLPKYLSL